MCNADNASAGRWRVGGWQPPGWAAAAVGLDASLDDAFQAAPAHVSEVVTTHAQQGAKVGASGRTRWRWADGTVHAQAAALWRRHRSALTVLPDRRLLFGGSGPVYLL